MRSFLTFCTLLMALSFACAQEPASHGIPNDVYYLMPSFAHGVIYFRGQSPAQGDLNICAVDNSLRFKDKDGKELVAGDADNIVMVQIDTVSFIRHEGVFYRMYSVSSDLGVALRRRVRIITDAKPGAYGTTSQTSSAKEYSSLYADGAMYNLNSDKTYPYEVEESVYLYKGNAVFPLSKKNLKKLFPDKKEMIDAYFKAGHALPKTPEEAGGLLKEWLFE